MLDKNNSSLECDDEKWMKRAFELAKKAESIGEVPVGAVLVSENTIIGEGYNSPISTSDATAHAEINAIRNARASESNYRLPKTTNKTRHSHFISPLKLKPLFEFSFSINIP